MRDSTIQLIRLALLFATAFVFSLWFDGLQSTTSLQLPDGWKSARGLVQNVTGGLKMPPGQEVTYFGLNPKSDQPYELELYLRVEEFGRIALGIGPEANCSAFEIETSLAYTGSVIPPARINMVFDTQGYVLYYENGKPVRKIAAKAQGASCFVLKSLDSVLTLKGFREQTGSTQKYKQDFLVPPKVTFRILPMLSAMMVVLGILAFVERRIALSWPKMRPGKAARSMAIHITPLLITASLSFVWEWSAMAVWPALGWFVLSRFWFAFRYARFFDIHSNSPQRIKNALAAVILGIAILTIVGHFSGIMVFSEASSVTPPVMFILTGCVIAGILLSIVKSNSRVHKIVMAAGMLFTVAGTLAAISRIASHPQNVVLISLALASLPFGTMCLLARHGKSNRLYGLWMFLLTIVFFMSIEAGLQLSPLVERLRPMGLDAEHEEHDLLIWVPMDFISEDQDIQVQHYSVPRINFRSGATSPEKPKDVYRIAVLGGSNTWGDGIDDPDKIFSEELERILNERKTAHYEVINAGVKGYASLQVFVLLKHYVIDYNPDMAIFYILRNDLVQNWGIYTMREMYQMATSKRLSAVRKTQSTLSQIGLYNGLVDIISTLRQELSARTEKKLNLKAVKTDEDFRKNLEDIVRVCKENGIQPVFAVEFQSADHAIGYDYIVTDLERYMIEYAEKMDVPLLNVNRYFFSKENWREIILPHDWVHLNEKGHKQVGQLLADFLIEQKLVD